MKIQPVATYRVQMHAAFGFDDAAGIVSYLHELGISHLYSSPYFQAAKGSTHGYDVVDPARLNEELGDERSYQKLCDALDAAGMNQMLDIVPNHMAIIPNENPWWWDVLENGQSSPYAGFYDVDWEASEDRWPDKIMLPILGDHYGRVLENGELTVEFDNCRFKVRYFDNTFPLDPSSLAELLNRAAESLDSDFLNFLAESHARLPQPTVQSRILIRRRHRYKTVLRDLLAREVDANKEVAKAIEKEIGLFNRDADLLDRLLSDQNYRLAYWRTAKRDLGYRRFFDVNTLAGLRVEEPEVFEATHALTIDLVRRGVAEGLRVDHPDGLRDPMQYFQRLREYCPQAWIVAEKILESGEKLPPEWPIAGTTGYEFLNLAAGLMIHPDGEAPLTEFYQEITGSTDDYAVVLRSSKEYVLTELLASEVNRLTSLFIAICEAHRRHRDYTGHELREALMQTAVEFPVYRTYVRAPIGEIGEADRGYINASISRAKTRRPDIDPELFDFLCDILLLKMTGQREQELAMHFQQLTGPAMAKGAEDTAFYRYCRMICLNEVGGSPDLFGIQPEGFHRACMERQQRHPLALLASSTHDTKRSEDVRARLAVLSEIPQQWIEIVRNWMKGNEKHRLVHSIDSNAEYFLYQTVVGAWPIDQDRLSKYMVKAAREAKVHTSWIKPDEKYEKQVSDFIGAILNDGEFVQSLESFAGRIIHAGRVNSLGQTMLKLTAPGVPDIYQGTETWNLSLVDPDNRRPVNYDEHRRLLKASQGMNAEAVTAHFDSGMPKLWLIHKVLQFRKKHPDIFGPAGAYQPLTAKGMKAEHLIAFVRADAAIIIVPRLTFGLKDAWEDTSIELPQGRWNNLLTEQIHMEKAPVKDLLSVFPVALLYRVHGDFDG